MSHKYLSCTDDLFLIARKDENLYLVDSDIEYNNFIVIGIDIKSESSFLCQMKYIDNLVYLYYQLYEYEPNIYNKQFEIYICPRNHCRYTTKNKIIDILSLYNRFWYYKVKLIFKQFIDYNLDYFISINSNDQTIYYFEKVINIRKGSNYFNVNNCKLLI